MANTFRSDNEGVTDLLNLAPDDGIVVGRQTAEVLKLAIFCNLGERGTVCLTNGDEFTALVSPTPRTGAFADSITKLLMCLEIV